MIDSGASTSAVGERLEIKLGIWKRARKIKVKQGDRSCLNGKFVVNTSFNMQDTSVGWVKFMMDAKVLDIGNREVILGLSWLMENGFLVDTQDWCLRNINTGQVIPCSVR